MLNGETLLQENNLLVVDGTGTQVLADSMTIAASALSHCAA